MKRIRALVIDDEQIVLDSIRKILKDQNYDVDVTLKSREGIEWAINENYDIVLTDIRMPEVGGMRVLRDIKRMKPGLPVIMVTGYATVRSAVESMKLGASDYIEKPFSPEDLIDAIEKALQKAKTMPPEEHVIIHKDEVLNVLDRTAVDSEFDASLLYHGSDALNEYNLTGPEKLAIMTGDVVWIEEQIGPLTPLQKRWLSQRLSAEIW